MCRLPVALFFILFLGAAGCNRGGSSGSGSGNPATDGSENPPSDGPSDGESPGEDATFSLESASPEAFASNIDDDVEVTLTFTEALDPDSVTGDTVRIISTLTGRLPVAFRELEDDDRTLVVSTERPFRAGETVVVEILSTLLAASGAHFEGETIAFRTGTAGPVTSRVQGQAFTALGRLAELEFGDLDQDGHLDMIYTVENGTTVDVLLGAGDGTFLPALRIDPMQVIHSLVVTDLDVDGDLDVVVGAADRARAYLNRTTEEWDGAPPEDLSFAFGPEAPVGAGVRSVAVGNLDFDATPDLVLSTDRGIEVRLDGPGQPVVQRIGDSRQARTELILADVDLNGTLDLLYGNRTGGRVTLHRGTGDPDEPFEVADHIELNTEPEQLAVANFAGDGMPEIVVLTLDGASQATAFRLLRSPDGDGVFVVDGEFGPDEDVENSGSKVVLDEGRFTVGDLGGDGLLDIVLAAEALGRLVAFENNGTAQPFSGPGQNLLDLPGPQATASEDVDGDGFLDIVVASGNELHLLLATGQDTLPPDPPVEGPYVLSVDDVEVLQGAVNSSTFVRLTNPSEVEAYTTVLSYDPAVLEPKEVTLDGTVTGTAAPEFETFNLDPELSEFTYAVLIDFQPPFENRTIPIGEDQLLYRLVFDVQSEAPAGLSAVAFVTDAERAKSNIVVVDASSITPELTNGSVQILEVLEPPPDAPNVMSIPKVTLAPGAEGFVPVLGTLSQDADAFTTVVTYDTSILEIIDLPLTGSVTEPLEPELLIPSIREAEGHIVFTAILDFVPPFLRQVIPPGTDHELFSIQVRVRPETPLGTVTPLLLTNGVGSPPLNNIFVFGGRSIFPALVQGEVRVDESAGPPPPPAGPTFLRGDPTSDRTVNLTDALFITNFLFTSGVTPECRDAADVDDDGRINLTDALFLLNYLSARGPAPPLPFPDPGLDPTLDDLSCDVPLSP